MKEHLFTFNFSLSLVQEPHAAHVSLFVATPGQLYKINIVIALLGIILGKIIFNIVELF